MVSTIQLLFCIKMKKSLIIVESPAKIKTLKKFLGSKYMIESSVGHIRDLPKKGFGIDIKNDFEPQYVLLDEKKEVIQKLQQAAKMADIVYLAPDPDREGEAIAWHILSTLPAKIKSKRVTFNAITKESVLEALKHPRDINQALVDAQQARRLLDRIVGYKISPILTRRVQGNKQGGLSAGRVQSVALKLVVDREKEIEAFRPVEYWNIFVHFQSKKKTPHFIAHLHSVDGKKLEKESIEGKDVFLIPNEAQAHLIVERLKKAQFKVINIEKKEKRRHPVAPFITSTLQQEASRHFGFSSTRTMNIAQTLYEGVELGEKGSEGLITYMRTDSVRVAPEALHPLRDFIKKTYGEKYLSTEVRNYSTKKSAQDAHEAIRPTHLSYSPEAVQKYLTSDQNKIYSLIWKRFIASQMASAVYDTLLCDIQTNEGIILRATGSSLKFSGFLTIYEEKQDPANEHEKKGTDRILPPLEVGQTLEAITIEPEQSFTKPSPRYTEASLVKELEKLGIGRPSTYATIMQKIQSRDYTIKEKGSLKPTELGIVIAQMLEDNFKLIMDVSFTATMEDALEQIAENKLLWKTLITEFWKEFIPTVENAEKEAFVPKVLTDLICPKCQHPLQKIWSRNKYFYGCSHYPECDYTAPTEELNFNKEDYAPDFDWNQHCPKCSKEMKLKFGRFGPFLGCVDYPQCKGIVGIPKKGDVIPTTMPACPAIGCNGSLAARRSRFGKTFFSCSNYPDCDVIVNQLTDLSTKYLHHHKTPYQKKTSSSIKSKGKKTSLSISAELEAIIGANIQSRAEATKKLWEYIKTHKLQNPKNKREILPDTKLAKFFNSKKPVNMMQIAKHVSTHLNSKKS